MRDGFIKVAAASPRLKVADCAHNAAQLAAAAKEAASRGVGLLVTPELGLTGSTCGDLFLQESLLADALAALMALCEQTAKLEMLLFVGMPLRHRGKLYSCALALHGGRVLGAVPKSCPPVQELRHFSPAFAGVERLENGPLRGAPIGTQIFFCCENQPALVVAAELGEDISAPAPPSILYAAAGATVLACLAAESEAVGAAARRRALVCGQSGRLACAYVYANAGPGESSTNAVYAGQHLIAENGALLAEAEPFTGQIAEADVDVCRLVHERQRLASHPDAGADGIFSVAFSLPARLTALGRAFSPTPFVPKNEDELASRCQTILSIQAAGLEKRLRHVGAKAALVGVSGGLDSTLALLVAARAMGAMGRPASDIHAVTMPGFGTTARTRGNAEALCRALGTGFEEIDITDTVRAHFKDIAHGEDNHDTVYENAQARVRTLTLMDIANQRGGLVVGTGDLSELALGWATYNGDHMSMYSPNADVPKTLIRYLIAFEGSVRPELHEVLKDVLATPVSPELLPPENGEISQKTEELVGPYELHDFFLYYLLRWGFPPAKILRLALAAFAGQYEKTSILRWMKVFYARFFSQQYKRSCLPDGPRVGSVSLSPRGDWLMPSDASAAAWLRKLDTL